MTRHKADSPKQVIPTVDEQAGKSREGRAPSQTLVLLSCNYSVVRTAN